MNLKKQLFITFVMVAILPLLIIGIYLFGMNIDLALNLYQQNLYNSTVIQKDIINESITRMLVRTGNLAQSRGAEEVCLEKAQITDNEKLTDEIMNFTNETLESVALFALADEDGNILYASGSNSDIENLKNGLNTVEQQKMQYLFEISLGGEQNNLAIYSPVISDGNIVGSFIAVMKSEHFMKLISDSQQPKFFRAFIFCKNHYRAITDQSNVEELKIKLKENQQQGNLVCKIGEELSLVQYSNIAKTEWMLVNSIPVKQIIALIFNYGIAGAVVILAVAVIILFLSRYESRKILKPMEKLLGAVEQFFILGGKFPQMDINPKTEIGYLAARFMGMSYEMSEAQSKLKESNFLYNTLLKATYEIRILIDLKENKVETSSDYLTEKLSQCQEKSAAERVLNYLEGDVEEMQRGDLELLRSVVLGHKHETAEVVVSCEAEEEQKKCWYRVISVPIVDGDCIVQRVVLHLEDITDRKLEEIRLVKSSQTDALCGLLNRNAFYERVREKSGDLGGAIFFIDLDQFKAVNDNLGHAAGDEILLAASKKIRSLFRTADVVGRYGGDEFVVFAPNISCEQARIKAERLVKVLIFDLEMEAGKAIRVTASVGVYLSEPNAGPEQSVQMADAAMYYAKQNGKAGYHITLR